MSDELLSSGLYCMSIAFRPTLQPPMNSDYLRTSAEPPNGTSHPSQVLCPATCPTSCAPGRIGLTSCGNSRVIRPPPFTSGIILSIPAIFEHSGPTLIMTYVLGDAPFLRMNFRSTPALALDSILFRFLPELIIHHPPAFFWISYHPPAEHYSSAPRPSRSFIHTPLAIFRSISGYPDRSSAHYWLTTECPRLDGFQLPHQPDC
ncbi:hypothetical protein K438DRAFT_1968487 [Mycena galopus ATCC 62051]|nr:hypothetical protein K438DRAFT_1968487 [Mycena galopus ATCC 62051]